jgi:cardiolipin synthase
MLSNDLVSTLAAAQKRLPVETWKSLGQGVRNEAGVIATGGIGRVVATVANPEVKWELKEGLNSAIGSAWAEVSLVIQTIDHCAAPTGKTMEMVWSGPSSVSLTARRIDQIIYDLLAQARHRAFRISFSAYRVPRLCEALAGAHRRGVKVTLLLETADDSEGQLRNDALDAFAGLPLREFEILHWPKAQRELNVAGKPGKLHAKCAVIDDAVVISSANLTDDAFNRNMEMGVVAHDVPLAMSVRTHFEELKTAGVLTPYSLVESTSSQIRAP